MKKSNAIIAAVILLCATLLFANSWNGFTLTASAPSSTQGLVTFEYPALSSDDYAYLDANFEFETGGTHKEIEVNGPCPAGTLNVYQGSKGRGDIECVEGGACCYRGGDYGNVYDIIYP